MGAGNLGGPAGREMARRMREQQGDDRDPNAMGGFRNTPLRQEERRPAAGVQDTRDILGGGRGPDQFGGGNDFQMPGFAEEGPETGDLVEPGQNSPDPDALRAVAATNKRRAGARADARQAKFMEKKRGSTGGEYGGFDEPTAGRGMEFGPGRAMRDIENMPGTGAGAPKMSPVGPNNDRSMVRPFDYMAMLGGPKQQQEEEFQARQPVPGQELQAGQLASQIRANLVSKRDQDKNPTLGSDYLTF